MSTHDVATDESAPAETPAPAGACAAIETPDPVAGERFAASLSDLDLDAGQRAAVDRIRTGGRADLYLWGPVGRGKSLLAERYLAAVGAEPALRLHLDELFRRLQAEIVRDWKAPAVVLRRLLADVRALLVDEFHVHDVADAVYLTALLQVAAEDGIVLIATSNYPPAGLLPDPAHHHRFLPAIAAIEDRFSVVEMPAGPDHRARGADAHLRFAAGSWGVAASDAPHGEVVLDAAGIPLTAAHVDGEGVVFTFAQLCEANVGIRQYQWLAGRFAAVALHGVPDLAAVRREPLMRFTTLVDVLYEHDVRLDVTAAAPFSRLVDADRPPLDAVRALSRLSALRG